MRTVIEILGCLIYALFWSLLGGVVIALAAKYVLPAMWAAERVVR